MEHSTNQQTTWPNSAPEPENFRKTAKTIRFGLFLYLGSILEKRPLSLLSPLSFRFKKLVSSILRYSTDFNSLKIESVESVEQLAQNSTDSTDPQQTLNTPSTHQKLFESRVLFDSLIFPRQMSV